MNGKYIPELEFLIDHGIITPQQATDVTKLANGKHPVEILLSQNEITKHEAELAMSCNTRHMKKFAQASSKLAKFKMDEVQRSIKEINTLIKHVNIWS